MRALIILGLILSSIVNVAEATDFFSKKLSDSALERTNHFVIYNGAYRKIKYPNGDVPATFGVCTDVVIRSYRTIGIDLQKDVHEHMKANFDLYPKFWGLKKPDSNIDHRRVPNLQTLFKHKGASLETKKDPKIYKVGDIVTWMVGGNLPHIGLVVDKRSSDGKRPMIVHNIGWGPKLEDMIFDYPITGHYRYTGNNEN